MRSFWMLPLFVLTGCEGQICALIGNFVGAYEGDASGGLDATVSELKDDPDNVQVTFVLAADPEEYSGSSTVSCVDGQLTLELHDSAADAVGVVTGLLEEGKGSGGYELLNGLTGTWSYEE
jgi:hypothetical protein